MELLTRFRYPLMKSSHPPWAHCCPKKIGDQSTALVLAEHRCAQALDNGLATSTRIRADILALEKETEGLLGEIIGAKA